MHFFENNNENGFESDEDEFVAPKNNNKFVLDPENGGGRRHKVRNVSRIDHLKKGKPSLNIYRKDLFGSKASSDLDNEMRTVESVEAIPFNRITEEK